MKKLNFALFLIFCFALDGLAQSRVTVAEKQIAMPTYPVAPDDKNPVL